MFAPLALFDIDRRYLSRKRHVLIVEDDDDWAEAIEDALSLQGGWTFRRAATAETGIRLWASERFDLVLLDRSLTPTAFGEAGADEGGALLREMRSNGVRTPVIMLTSHVDGEIEGLDFGADDYVSKVPFRPELLMARINKLMRRFDDDGLVIVGKLEVFVTTNRILFNRLPLSLGPLSHALLGYLAMRYPEPVSVGEMLQVLWRARPDQWSDGTERAASASMVGSRQVEVAISSLRRDLATAGLTDRCVEALQPQMSLIEAKALALPPDERASARRLTKAWALNAVVLQDIV
jgi:DNA-binding response OmpR family regulator